MFWTCIVIFSKPLIYAGIGVFKALAFIKKVEFDDVFWVIQLGSIV